MQKRTYQELQPEERMKIESMKQPGSSIHATARLLRRYLPKGTDLSVYNQDEFDAIACSLNSRPRVTHAFHSPFEMFERTLATASITSAAVH
ncbi:IS30 family transposase [Paraburkholderia sp. EB58]|jgi:IS30 family transposase